MVAEVTRLALVAMIVRATVGCSPGELTPTIPLAGPTSLMMPASGSALSIELKQPTYLFVTATQDRLDVTLELTDPEGHTIVVDSPTERDGDEYFGHEANQAGIYSLSIIVKDRGRATGNSSIRVYGLPGTTRSDRRRREAVSAWTRGSLHFGRALAARDDATKETFFLDAVSAFARSAKHWAQLEQTQRGLLARYAVATVHYERGDWASAARTAGAAVERCIEAGPTALCARLLHRQAEALLETGADKEIEHAGELLQRALALQEQQGEHFEAAVTTNTIGRWHYERGAVRIALAQFEDAGKRFAALDERREASKTYNNVAKMHERLGQYDLALPAYRTAVRLARAGGYAFELSAFLEGSADTLVELGNMEEALLRYHEAAEVAARLNYAAGEARALDGIGRVYEYLANWQTAATFLRRALERHEDTREIRPQIETNLHLGNVYRHEGRYAEAIAAHERALALPGRDLDRAAVRLELARDFRAQGDIEAALDQLETVLSMTDTTTMPLIRAYALTERGSASAATQPERSLRDLTEALRLHQGTASQHGEIQSALALAELYRNRGDLMGALDHARQAQASVEAVRSRIGHAGLRYTYASLQWPIYDLLIDVLMRLQQQRGDDDLGYTVEAFETSEYLHALTLVEHMIASREVLSMEAAAPLTRRHKELRRELAAVGAQATESAQERVSELIVELDVIEARLRGLGASDTRQGAAPRARLADVQRLLGDTPGAVLLEFVLGEQASTMWVVEPDSIESVRLAARPVIERQAIAAYNALRTPPSGRVSDVATPLADLSSLLLGSVSGRAYKTVIVVPDGALHYIPFSALSLGGHGAPLLRSAQVVVVPSASVLLAQERNLAQRGVAQRYLSLIADPVFSPSDSRLSGITTAAPGQRDPALVRLPYTALEARMILETMAPGTAVTTLTGFDAHKERVLEAGLKDHRIVHFASHGLIDTSRPELSAIALSGYDERGVPQDSFLQLDDIYRLELNADLVVLSACNTALGLELRGEGLVGLVDAFMRAGARSVVATQWAVPDRATARLMGGFYRRLAEGEASVAEALRAAQVDIASTAGWDDPYFWAPFVYQGDWRQVWH